MSLNLSKICPEHFSVELLVATAISGKHVHSDVDRAWGAFASSGWDFTICEDANVEGERFESQPLLVNHVPWVMSPGSPAGVI